MPRSPRAAWARISARQAPSCARSIASSCCAAGIAVSGSTCSRSSASATRAGTVAHPLPLGGQPGVEGRDRRRPGPRAARRPAATATPDWSVVARSTSSTSTHTSPGTQREVVAGDREDLGPRRRKRLQQPVDLLAQRGTRLLLGPAAPQQFGETAAQRGPRRRQRDDGQQRAGLAPGRQHVLAGDASRPPSGRSAAAARTTVTRPSLAGSIWACSRSVCSVCDHTRHLVPSHQLHGASGLHTPQACALRSDRALRERFARHRRATPA